MEGGGPVGFFILFVRRRSVNRMSGNLVRQVRTAYNPGDCRERANSRQVESSLDPAGRQPSSPWAIQRRAVMKVRQPRALLLSLALLSSTAWADNWPAWRGPGGTGVSAERNLPLTWNQKQNVRWKVALPAPGN